jgi:hypothetical protein
LVLGKKLIGLKSKYSRHKNGYLFESCGEMIHPPPEKNNKLLPYLVAVRAKCRNAGAARAESFKKW